MNICRIRHKEVPYFICIINTSWMRKSRSDLWGKKIVIEVLKVSFDSLCFHVRCRIHFGDSNWTLSAFFFFSVITIFFFSSAICWYKVDVTFWLILYVLLLQITITCPCGNRTAKALCSLGGDPSVELAQFQRLSVQSIAESGGQSVDLSQFTQTKKSNKRYPPWILLWS